MVTTPVLLTVTSLEREVQVGTPTPFPRRIRPGVGAAVTLIAPPAFPKSRPLVVNVVTPVPPLPTGKVPVTSVVRSTEVPSDDSRLIVPAPLVMMILGPADTNVASV